MVPDVNVLVAASRSDHPHHRIARSWLNDALAACAAGASLKLPPMVVAGFLRLVTHPRIFVTPTPVQEAVGFVDALLSICGVDMPAGGRNGRCCVIFAWSSKSNPTVFLTPDWPRP